MKIFDKINKYIDNNLGKIANTLMITALVLVIVLIIMML